MEEMILARKEAELIHDRPPKFINQALLPFFENRNVESIKRQRRKRDYKETVNNFLESSKDVQQMHNITNIPSDASPPTSLESTEDDHRKFLTNFPHFPADEAVNSQTLTDSISDALQSGKADTFVRLSLYIKSIFLGQNPVATATTLHPQAPKPTFSRRKERRREHAEVLY